MIRDDDYRRDQLNQDLMLKKYELELKYQTQVDSAQIMAMQAVDREAVKQQGILQAQAMQAAQEQQPPINPQGMVY
jgi:hypothetical protein